MKKNFRFQNFGATVLTPQCFLPLLNVKQYVNIMWQSLRHFTEGD